MSKENALTFLEKIETDPAFRKAVVEKRKQAFRAELPQASSEEQKALGFDIKDMHEAMRGRGVRLSTDELREITGGAEAIKPDQLEIIALMHVYGVTAVTDESNENP